MTNLQELYLAHNRVDFAFAGNLEEIGGGPSRRNYQAVWPVLEVLDLTNNSSTDISQIEYLFSGLMVSPNVIKIVAISGTFGQAYGNSESDVTLLLGEEKCP